MPEDMQQQLVEFERNRVQLLSVSAQKQQFQLQSNTMAQSIEELEKTKEKKVFKAVGNILVQSDTEKVRKELVEKKESLDLRIKSLQKQEDSLVNRLNKLKSDIENAQSAAVQQEASAEEKS